MMLNILLAKLMNNCTNIHFQAFDHSTLKENTPIAISENP